MIYLKRPTAARGIWDQGLSEEALAGELWPTRLLWSGSSGDVVVMLTHGPLAAKTGYRPEPGLLIHTSDEEGVWRPPLHHGLIWRQYPRPDSRQDRAIPCGYPPDVRATCWSLGAPVPASRRSWLWAFAGQKQNESRALLCDILSGTSGALGCLAVSGGFAQGLGRVQYLGVLAGASVAPCPVGNVSPDTMRLYEALEAGCIPVVERTFPGWPASFDFWGLLFGRVPFPVVETWRELPAILNRYREDPAALQRDMNAVQAWWLGEKRRFVLDLEGAIIAVGGTVDRNDLTIVIPTSPIPAHPSTDLIEDTIRRLRDYPGLQSADVLIMVDGVRPEQEERRADYEEYTRRLLSLCAGDTRFRGCLPVVFDKHTHQVGMLRETLKSVRTKLVMYVEHDTWPTGPIDFDLLFRAFRSDEVDVLRLSIYANVIPGAHDGLYSGHVERVEGVPLMRTKQWSQRPHIARTDWYRRVLDQHFHPDDVGMIEDKLWSEISRAPQEAYRIWVYTPDGDWTRSGTADGRRTDPKYPMKYRNPDGSWLYVAGMPGKE